MSDQRDNGIAWTDQTWNPIRGCSRVSAGCERCYAETQAARFCGEGQPYHGLVRRTERGRAQWTGTVRVVPDHIDDPLRWKRPRRVFVNSMSDLFHESLSNEDIAAVFGVMSAAPQHTFQVLTKRAKRMREWFAWAREFAMDQRAIVSAPNTARTMLNAAAEYLGTKHPGLNAAWRRFAEIDPWPLPNVWLGVSCEDQRAADERIPELLATPAAVRFVSAEPLLGPIDLRKWTLAEHGRRHIGALPGLSWVIVGGESGPYARPCDVAWIRSIVDQCREANVACFVKQLGARPVVQHPMDPGSLLAATCVDRKGGDPSEWTDDLRVREFPR